MLWEVCNPCTYVLLSFLKAMTSNNEWYIYCNIRLEAVSNIFLIVRWSYSSKNKWESNRVGMVLFCLWHCAHLHITLPNGRKCVNRRTKFLFLWQNIINSYKTKTLERRTFTKKDIKKKPWVPKKAFLYFFSQMPLLDANDIKLASFNCRSSKDSASKQKIPSSWSPFDIVFSC